MVQKRFQRFSLALDLLNNIIKIEENLIYRNMFCFSNLKSSSFTDGAAWRMAARGHEFAFAVEGIYDIWFPYHKNLQQKVF